MQLLVIERSLLALLRRPRSPSIRGRLGRQPLDGVHLERGDEIRIEGSRSSVLLDGELFEADDRPPDRAAADRAGAVPEARRLTWVPPGDLKCAHVQDRVTAIR